MLSVRRSRHATLSLFLLLSVVTPSHVTAQDGGGAIALPFPFPLPFPKPLPIDPDILIDPLESLGTLIRFDNLPPGTVVSHQYAAEGVIFENGPLVRTAAPVSSMSAPNVIESPAVPDLPQHIGPMRIRFTAPVRLVSIFYGERYGGGIPMDVILRAYDATGNEIARNVGRVAPKQNVHSVLAVEVTTNRIARAEVHYARADSLDGVPIDFDLKGVETIDNLYFEGGSPPPPPPDDPPTVSITSPSDGQIIFGNSDISFSGTVRDDQGLASLRLRLEYLDSSAATIDVNLEWSGSAPSFSFPRFSHSSLHLRPGRNRISITAMDSAGQSSNDTVLVHYGPAPEVTITAPEDRANLGDKALVVRGRVRKELGVLRPRDVTVDVMLGDTLIQRVRPETLNGRAPEYSFEVTVELSDAGTRTLNRIVATATDESGAPGADEILVVLNRPDLISQQMTALQAIEGGFLISGRQTVVRLHPFALEGTQSGIRAALHAYRDGVELPDSPLRPQGRQGVTIRPGADYGNVHTNMDSTWNFLLPTSWTASGDLDIVGIVDPENTLDECGTCLENNVREQTLHFTASESLTVRPVRMRGRDMNGNVVEPTATQATATMRDIARLMPYSTLTILPPARLMNPARSIANDRSALLEDLYDGFSCFDSFEGDFFGFLGTQIGGCSWSTYSVGVIPGIRGLSVPESPGGISSLRTSTAAHELAHALSRRHAGRSHGEAGADRSFPHPHGSVGGWGFDVTNWQVVRPNWPSGSFPSNLPKVSDNCDSADTGCPTHDYLSYGDGARWTSAYTWNNLWLHGFRGETGIFEVAGEGGGAGAPVKSEQVVHIRGTIDREGIVETRSFYTARTPEDFRLLPEEGELEASALSASGVVLAHRSLDPRGIDDSEQLLFSFLLPFPEGTASVRLEYRGELVDERLVSVSAPDVTVFSPVEGEVVVSDGLLTIRWEAFDADGDNLSYGIQYSADKGTSWYTLAMNYTDTELSLDASVLPGSPHALVRIMATDGLNTTRATSSLFQLEDQPPYVVILSPPEGAELGAKERLIFQGSVSDPEGRDASDPLDSKQIRWFSDKKGFLGSGTTIDVQQLKKGIHQLRLEATDRAGNVGSHTIEVYVGVEKPESVGREFIRGDVSDDGEIVLSDPVQLLNHLFLGGPGPICEDAGDVNDDGNLELTDGIHILNFLFLGGDAPASPFPAKGVDPTDDGLACSAEE